MPDWNTNPRRSPGAIRELVRFANGDTELAAWQHATNAGQRQLRALHQPIQQRVVDPDELGRSDIQPGQAGARARDLLGQVLSAVTAREQDGRNGRDAPAAEGRARVEGGLDGRQPARELEHARQHGHVEQPADLGGQRGKLGHRRRIPAAVTHEHNPVGRASQGGRPRQKMKRR